MVTNPNIVTELGRFFSQFQQSYKANLSGRFVIDIDCGRVVSIRQLPPVKKPSDD